MTLILLACNPPVLSDTGAAFPSSVLADDVDAAESAAEADTSLVDTGETGGVVDSADSAGPSDTSAEDTASDTGGEDTAEADPCAETWGYLEFDPSSWVFHEDFRCHILRRGLGGGVRDHL